MIKPESAEINILVLHSMFVEGGHAGEVVRPCPTVCHNIVTQSYLFFIWIIFTSLESRFIPLIDI